MSGSEIEKFREEINAMVGRTYRLGLDEARSRIAELTRERDEARRVARELARIAAYTHDVLRRDQLDDLDTALAYPKVPE